MYNTRYRLEARYNALVIIPGTPIGNGHPRPVRSCKSLIYSTIGYERNMWPRHEEKKKIDGCHNQTVSNSATAANQALGKWPLFAATEILGSNQVEPEFTFRKKVRLLIY